MKALGKREYDCNMLNPGARWRWMVGLTSRLSYPRRTNFGTHLVEGWVDPRAGVDVSENSLAMNNLRDLFIKHTNFQNYTFNYFSSGAPKKDVLSQY
jgi:hypothetical protein